MSSEEDWSSDICAKFEEMFNGLKILCKCNIFDTLFCKYAYINVNKKKEKKSQTVLARKTL